MADLTALTAYGAAIPKAFADRSSALAWVEEHGDRYGASRIVQQTKAGLRTIWRRGANHTQGEDR